MSGPQSARKSGKFFSVDAGGRGLYRIVSTMPDSLIPSLIAALMTTYISHNAISRVPSSSTIQKIVNRAISSSSALVFSMFGFLVVVSNRNCVALGHSATGAGLGHPDGNHGEINNPASLGGFL